MTRTCFRLRAVRALPQQSPRIVIPLADQVIAGAAAAKSPAQTGQGGVSFSLDDMQAEQVRIREELVKAEA